MDFLAFLLRSVLEFFTQRTATRQEATCPRRDVRRDLPEQAPHLGRGPGFGWMNVASMYDSPKAGPPSTGVPSMLDNRATRRGD
jgi:hypothetical protein